MGSTMEMIIVVVVVAAALIWAGWAGWRSVRKQGGCSSCGSSGDCPVVQNPDVLAELSAKGKRPQPDSCRPDPTSRENSTP